MASVSTSATSAMDSQASQNGVVRCHCGVEAPIWRSSKPRTKGLKFFGCPFYKEKDKYCKFFLWCDNNVVETKPNNPMQAADIDNRVLEKKIKALEAALEGSRTEIGYLKMLLQIKNEAIWWNRATIVFLFIILSFTVVKLLKN